MRKLTQVATQPVLDRQSEAHLAAAQGFPGQQVMDSALEQVFELAATIARLMRQRGDVLGKDVIEEWRARLERGEHACLIYLDQNIVGEVGLNVHLLHAGEEVKLRPLGELI